MLIALVATTLGWSSHPSADNLLHAAPAMLYIIVFATVLAALAFNKGVRTLGAAHGIVFINLVPVSALLIGAFRGSMPGLAEVSGTLLVIAALLLKATITKPRAVTTAA